MAAPPTSNDIKSVPGLSGPFSAGQCQNAHWVDELESVFVCVSFHRLYSLNIRPSFSSLFRTVNLRPSCGQVCVLLRPLSLALRWCLLGVSSCGLFFVCICVLGSSCDNASGVGSGPILTLITFKMTLFSNVVMH